jgi:hypothetical protein
MVNTDERCRSQQDAEVMVAELIDQGENLTNWEAAFIDDLQRRGHWITDKQREIVARIYRERIPQKEQLWNWYRIVDKGGLLLITTAMEAFDRLKQAQRTIAEDGAFFDDRYGHKKTHPALDSEHKARAHMLLALKQLNLDIDPQKAGAITPLGGSVTTFKR